MLEDNEDTFLFNSKKEYEEELMNLLKSSKKSKKKKEQYDELVEEYLRFCTSGEENGK